MAKQFNVSALHQAASEVKHTDEWAFTVQTGQINKGEGIRYTMTYVTMESLDDWGISNLLNDREKNAKDAMKDVHKQLKDRYKERAGHTLPGKQVLATIDLEATSVSAARNGFYGAAHAGNAITNRYIVKHICVYDVDAVEAIRTMQEL